jgi:polysaccharide export outer membrane protein
MKLRLNSFAIGAVLLAAVLLTGCQSTSPLPPQPILTQAGPLNGPMGPIIYTNTGTNVSPILQVNDIVSIEFSGTPERMQPYKDKIRDDGTLVLPYNVMVKAAGSTASQLQDAIHAAYVPSLFRHLTATVKTEERFYFVGGEVRNPSRQLYIGDMTVLRAIDTAGGFTDFANRKNIELRRSNGQIQRLNWKDAMKDSKRDLAVYPNDQIIVRKRIL